MLHERDPRLLPVVGDVLHPQANLAVDLVDAEGVPTSHDAKLYAGRWRAEVEAVEEYEVRVTISELRKGGGVGIVRRGQRVPRLLWERLMIGAKIEAVGT